MEGGRGFQLICEDFSFSKRRFWTNWAAEELGRIGPSWARLGRTGLLDRTGPRFGLDWAELDWDLDWAERAEIRAGLALNWTGPNQTDGLDRWTWAESLGCWLSLGDVMNFLRRDLESVANYQDRTLSSIWRQLEWFGFVGVWQGVLLFT
ncbi:hypothetical protein CRG98_042164 [Punica granatum]|uniref:Uncharacterized protein n=1 Tax=Punica granatum TaxID=22663 RepID=A0A2I0I0E8_PUNGR|nr:hypothetical protein CRG98_042164 [Punica granatum]